MILKSGPVVYVILTTLALICTTRKLQTPKKVLNGWADDDILESPHEPTNRNAIIDELQKWDNKTVPYTAKHIDEGDMKVLLESIKDIEDNTCVKFVPKTDEDRNFVIFDGKDDRCASYVGRISGMLEGQLVALGHRCMTRGTIQHELMHTLGFWHEHQRADRDKYIRVMDDNIIDSKRRQFRMRADDEAMILGTYDYTSLLHYDAFAFTKNGKPSLQRRDGGFELGNRRRITRLDLDKVNRLYNCNRKRSRHPVNCKNDQDCEDDFPEECPELAAKGWCEKMPGKMLFKCKRSCCNCDGSQCMDTSTKYFYVNYCEHFFDKEQQEYIYSPATCMHPASADATRRFCPKLCNICESTEKP